MQCRTLRFNSEAAAAVGRHYLRELRAAAALARMERNVIRDEPCPLARPDLDDAALNPGYGNAGVSRARLPPGVWRRRPMNRLSGDPASSPVRSCRARS